MRGLLRPAHHGATIVVGLILVFLALTLLLIGANSPYTHANLGAAYDAAYSRTDQIVVGAAPAGRVFPARAADGASGEQLFVTAGCAGCHGLRGEGGALGLKIAGAAADLVMQKARSGSTHMPPFAADALSDQQIAQIAAYLGGSSAAQAATPAPTPAPPPTPPPASAAPTTAAASPSAAAASASAGSSYAALLARGKTIYETVGGGGCQECHGPDGRGRTTKDGTNAPNIRGATEQKFRDALNGGAALMVNLKPLISQEDVDAIMAYLDFLTQQP